MSLAAFRVSDPNCVLASPRSLHACEVEGIAPDELTYRPLESFYDGLLSPRLVALRYNVHEAKRHDLLASAIRAREILVASSEPCGGDSACLQLRACDDSLKLTKDAVFALKKGSSAQLETHRSGRALQREHRNFLERALDSEVSQLKQLEDHDTTSASATSDAVINVSAKEVMRRLAGRGDSIRPFGEGEAEGVKKLEQQIEQGRLELRREEDKAKASEEARRRREVCERKARELEAKVHVQAEKERRKAAEDEAQRQKKEHLHSQEFRRAELLEQQRLAAQAIKLEKKAAREARTALAADLSRSLECQRREALEEKERVSSLREQRRARGKAEEEEEMAKRSFQVMVRRKVVEEETARRSEERRAANSERKSETEARLENLEQRKEKHIHLKREVESLRATNKEMNIARQRRREEARQECLAAELRQKSEKADRLASEKRALWQARQDAAAEAQQCREALKSEILRRKISRKYSADGLFTQMNEIFATTALAPSKTLSSRMSLPDIACNRSF